MKTIGIRIFDIKNNQCIPLAEILENIPQANAFKWAILWIDVIPLKRDAFHIGQLAEEIKKSRQGLPFTFDSLKSLSKKIFQEINITIIASSSESNLHAYTKDQEMYENCEIVIEMIDGGFWEIFSKDVSLIEHFKKKYISTESLESDFQHE